MDENCIYEGMRAVCAVLAALEAGAAQRPALRLAERHLHLLADLAARGAPIIPGGPGEGCSGGLLAGARVCLPAPQEASDVLQ